jgi:protein-S-isoprenylcysteine O-methyltransferase Ste14
MPEPIARLIVVVCFIAIALRLAVAAARSPARRRPTRRELAWSVPIWVVIVAAWTLTPSDWMPQAIQMAASVVAILAVGWLGWSYHVLGTSFSVDTTPVPAHQLRTTGPYARIRHPVYAGLVVYTIAAAVVISPGLLLVTAGVLVCVRRQIKAEEESLAAQYDQRWDNYRATVPRVLFRRRRQAQRRERGT